MNHRNYRILNAREIPGYKMVGPQEYNVYFNFISAQPTVELSNWRMQFEHGGANLGNQEFGHLVSYSRVIDNNLNIRSIFIIGKNRKPIDDENFYKLIDIFVDFVESGKWQETISLVEKHPDGKFFEYDCNGEKILFFV